MLPTWNVTDNKQYLHTIFVALDIISSKRNIYIFYVSAIPKPAKQTYKAYIVSANPPCGSRT
jgi:hypothetical protein